MSKGEFRLQRLYRIFSRIVIVITILAIGLFFGSFAKYMQVQHDLKRIEEEWSKSQFNLPLIEYLRLPVEKKKEVDEKKEDYILRALIVEKGIPLWRTRMFAFCIIAFIFGTSFIGGASLYRYLLSRHWETTNPTMSEDGKSD